jgi:RNA polymerase sigma factor (sigma-70 family)
METGDGELLRRFVRARDQAAFELLVWRHGPMVFGLCRRLLRHEQDAEDAFQATFLALARKAGSIGNGNALASWLYKVAYRVACRAGSRVSACSNASAAMARLPAAEKEHDLVRADVRAALDREIGSLPERYRRVIVLCYFEGKTQEEAAHVLRCPKGTVSARLTRARERLGRRLKRHNWALSAGALTGMLMEQAATAVVPAHLTRVTAQAALSFAAGNVARVGLVSVNTIALAEGVLRMLWYSKLKVVAGVVVAVLLAGTGTGLAVRSTWAGGNEDGSTAQTPLPAKAQEPGREAPIGAGDRVKAGQPLAEISGPDHDSGQQAKFELIPLHTANAGIVAHILDELFKKDGITVLAVPESNSLLVRASTKEFNKVRDLVRQALDQPEANPAMSVRLHTLPLKHARAADVATVLRDVYFSRGTMGSGRDQGANATSSNQHRPMISITVDERTNSLVVACSDPMFKDMVALTDQLDQVAKQVPSPQVRLIGLKFGTAADIAGVLRDIYGDLDKSTAFSADTRTNRLIIRCPPALVDEIDALIRQLDVK